MKQSFILGQYIPRDSFIHRLDPRTKIISLILFVITMFVIDRLFIYSLLYGFVLGCVLLSTIPITYLIKGLKPVWWLVVITFIFHVLFQRDGEALFDVFGFIIYDQGFIQGGEIASRLLLMIVMATLLTLTTPPLAITDAMRWFLAPLTRLGLPINELAIMMAISLRLIPTMTEEMDKISKAQAARGLDYTRGRLRDRLKALLPLLIPLFISAFKRAEALAMAMEARGYQGADHRTSYRQIAFRTMDYIIVCLMTTATVSIYLMTG
ncbi:energy-coupling factor transporter transmembrane component T family protein [Alkalibacillus salilacus]|uniref:Energy-coupling factor transport system permease protein n=1 Tax=Alkalibacillus salilacus TaxID=284582 RepID=A0ABT9VHD0_9BACI|nr:energy-coupling factor transporter transmembrane component T [Alkalibacillus salilacus]MDQ0160374.1 energy-coupling factor transport system permease protein [Alkalibacillus salilacus]